MSAPALARFAVASALVAGTILVSILPSGDQVSANAFQWIAQSPPPMLQNVMHVVVYAALAWSVAWSLEGYASWRRRAATAFLACLALGIALEWLQTLVPGRFGTLLDVGLNMIGVLLGLQVARRSRTSGA